MSLSESAPYRRRKIKADRASRRDAWLAQQPEGGACQICHQRSTNITYRVGAVDGPPISDTEVWIRSVARRAVILKDAVVVCRRCFGVTQMAGLKAWHDAHPGADTRAYHRSKEGGQDGNGAAC